MSYSPKASQEYLKNAVMTATPEQLQLMLYDGAIKFATRGSEAMQAKDREATFNALERAQRIVLELANGIRPDVNPELAEQMAALYNFVYMRLVEGNLHQDPNCIEDALRVLRHLRETWVMLMDKIRQDQAQSPQPASAGIAPAATTPQSPQPTRSPLRPADDDEPSSLDAQG